MESKKDKDEEIKIKVSEIEKEFSAYKTKRE
jgi:hypothetical protein